MILGKPEGPFDREDFIDDVELKGGAQYAHAVRLYNWPVQRRPIPQDDGLPKPREPVARQRTDVAATANATRQANSNSAPRARGLTVGWMQLRGPAKVTFEKAAGIAVVDARTYITARARSMGSV